MNHKKTLLAILDGWGLGHKPDVDAIVQGDTRYYDYLRSTYPTAELITHGSQVGLPEGQMGNSEVGHLNIGAGRIVYQELARINKAIDNQTLLNEKTIQQAISYALMNQKPVHFMGLLSDGGVHAHIEHLIALVNGFSLAGVDDIRIHAFLDGRDTDPNGGANYLKHLIENIPKSDASIVSVIGRYYAMDRDMRWERIKRAYDLLVNGVGEQVEDIVSKVYAYYSEGISDEFMEPIILDKSKTIKDGDLVFFVNFRTDRPRELTMALTQQAISEHEMTPLDLHFVTITEYNQEFKGLHVVFTKDLLTNTLGETLAKAGKSQVRIAETEKYPHVTFFFNGGREAVFHGEHRIMVPSPKVPTYDLQPEMSAQEITDQICSYLKSDHPDFICLNYANADMVGHTGDFAAAQVAVATVDKCLKRLVETALEHDYHIIIIADHGNSDYMINDDGSPHTAHTTNLVPVIYVAADTEGITIKSGKLADIAPTLLTIMGIETPSEMNGTNLIA